MNVYQRRGKRNTYLIIEIKKKMSTKIFNKNLFAFSIRKVVNEKK